MKIGVPKEVHAGEQRVALTPETAGRILKLGFELAIESGAGDAAQFSDDAYREAGVEVIDDTRALWAGSDIVLKVRQPEAHPGLGVDETELVPEGSTLISFVWPAQNEDLRKDQSAQGNGDRDGCRPAHQPCAEDGCPVVDGQHCWVPCSGRGGE